MLYVSTYRNKGYSFTITSSTAFDHKWIPNRNIFESISEVVDEVFASYLSRPNVRQPILTQYCDGQRVSCPNWLSQWGSNNYPLIPKIRVDGIYGEETQRAVEIFQDIFGLPETGEVDYRTWYKVQEIYVGVTRIAELY